MLATLWVVLTYPFSFFRRRHDLALEVLALRHPLMVLIRKYRPKFKGKTSQGWKTFLQNHAGRIAAMDFLVVPTVTFRLLYGLIVMTHERRKVVHFNITDLPTAAWTAQQNVNAFAHDTAPEYLLRNRDSIYGSVFAQRVAGVGIQQKLIA